MSGIGRHGAESALIGSVTAILIALILAPIAIVVVMSFTAASTLQFPPPGFSLRWYLEVWHMATGDAASLTRLTESFRVSVAIAALTAFLCVLASVPASYALVRYRFPGRSAVEELLGLPIVFPAVVLGIALLILVSVSGIEFGLWQIVAAHAITFLPFTMRNCITALKGVDPELEEAAKTLGASPLRTFVEIVLPLMRAGIAWGVLLVFILSFNEFTLSYFLYTVDVFPLSIWLFQQSNTSFSPAIFAVSALTIFFNIGIILTVDAIVGKRGGAHIRS
ncbi:ABC transporter permease [Bradyrhizobium cajani]|uniref:ABC transporter permease subunit n=1 Tax=Bradyrhizobium cajani TaxID=1928661 RepID=A0A844TN52_9BRAD|nr:ABC transporter permease [Bradyrhizobium cajani]MCP3371809.1 ABC transporter permease [Bradyrhizobium cajani]MVT76371.1 ABC transporter permease subunit [Bradyrhizobium cajani]